MNKFLFFAALAVLFFVPYASNAEQSTEGKANLDAFINFKSEEDITRFDAQQEVVGEETFQLVMGSEVNFTPNSAAYINYKLTSDNELSVNDLSISNAESSVSFGLKFIPF